MIRIISVITLLLACVLAAAPATAQDEPMQGNTPQAAPEGAAPEGVAPAEQAPAPTPVETPSADIKLQDAPPDRYTVKRGDTLWDISARFLKNPWKWPDVWGMNKDQVENPHLIYPGEVIILDLSGATPRLRLEGVPDGGLSRWYGYELQVSKLEPRMRSQALAGAIPTIPAKDLDPFLSLPLVLDPQALALAPRIVASQDDRVIMGDHDNAFAVGLEQKKGNYWNAFRPGRMFHDPDTREMLGYEGIYLADVEVQSFGEISPVRILRARQEVNTGDLLTVMTALPSLPYVPRAPARKIRGKIIAGSSDTVAEIAPLSVVVLNRGARDGLESGHVLALCRSDGIVAVGGRMVPLPEQQYGLALVYRVFNKLSYALVMTAQRPIHVNDIVKNP